MDQDDLQIVEGTPLSERIKQGLPVNNPFVPPKGCPVQDLPTELLAHIFVLGVQSEGIEDGEGSDDDSENWTDEEDEEGDAMMFPVDVADAGDEEDSTSKYRVVDRFGNKIEIAPKEMKIVDEDMDEESEPRLPFEVLVSHVCAQWRLVSLGQPQFWTQLAFGPGRKAPYKPREASPYERSKAYIARSGNFPLDIDIDTSFPEDGMSDDELEAKGVKLSMSMDELDEIMGFLTPESHRWHTFAVDAENYVFMHRTLEHLVAQCKEAPLLTGLQLRVMDDSDDMEHFQPPELSQSFVLFRDQLPKLENLSLWGVHVDWEKQPNMFSKLLDLELAYHAKDVRPTWQHFSEIICVSPFLETLTISQTGPKDLFASIETCDETPQLVRLSSLKNLVLADLETTYISALVSRMSFPLVTALALDLDEGDGSAFARQLAVPQPGETKSILAGLTALKVAGLSCDHDAVGIVYEELRNLDALNLNLSFIDEKWLKALTEPIVNAENPEDKRWYLPKLKTLTTSGVDGDEIQEFVKARKEAGAPLKKLVISANDREVLTSDVEKWLRNEVELDFFESDGEYDDDHSDLVLLDGDEEEFDDDDDEDMSDGDA